MFGEKKMRIIIAGGREFADYEYLKEQMDILISLEEAGIEIEVVCGMARGADSLGKRWAEERGHKVIEMPANWELHGRSAGYKRNEQMAIKAKEDLNNMLAAFWDGKTRGTSAMIDLAKKYDVPTYIFKY
jgi:hypothetical protein